MSEQKIHLVRSYDLNICDRYNCDVIASFNEPGLPPIKCIYHTNPGMTMNPMDICVGCYNINHTTTNTKYYKIVKKTGEESVMALCDIHKPESYICDSHNSYNSHDSYE